MEETIRSLKHAYCNWLRATTRAFPAMYTVGMITPSVKLYQPKPHGKQLHIILQKTLKEICIKYVMSSFPTRNYLLNKSKHMVPIKSSATMTLNTEMYVEKYNLKIYERNSTTILHLPVNGEHKRQQDLLVTAGGKTETSIWAAVLFVQREKRKKKKRLKEKHPPSGWCNEAVMAFPFDHGSTFLLALGVLSRWVHQNRAHVSAQTSDRKWHKQRHRNVAHGGFSERSQQQPLVIQCQDGNILIGERER